MKKIGRRYDGDFKISALTELVAGKSPVEEVYLNEYETFEDAFRNRMCLWVDWRQKYPNFCPCRQKSLS